MPTPIYSSPEELSEAKAALFRILVREIDCSMTEAKAKINKAIYEYQNGCDLRMIPMSPDEASKPSGSYDLLYMPLTACETASSVLLPRN